MPALRSRAPPCECRVEASRNGQAGRLPLRVAFLQAPDAIAELSKALTRFVGQREHEVTVFLMGDAASGAKAGQKTPDGFYNAERMVKRVTTKGNVLLCGTCMDARGITEEEVVKGAERSTMDALAEATELADKVMVF
jgi:uncharacterized protein involved in oxidation of intracellular sulfur